ncbi:MAG TPA: ATP-binding cassette domain-containing protein [Candidatus Saccharimonadia bacterium]|nr:ATP-binding cassette domain-containing protein [Candidatus Saccharimonadia bacterium]
MAAGAERPRADPQDTGAVIEVRGLRSQFGEQVVHEALDLDVLRGEVLGVVGGSGSGKSVLMRSIIGLKAPDGGTIRVLDADPNDERDRSKLERRTGVLFQGGALFSSLTVRENVELPLREHLPGIPAALRTQIAESKIGLAGLDAEAGAKFPAQLSGGMKKRAGLARALALDPEILFLDEPTAGLDPIGAAAFDELILTLRDALGLTVFLITHDLDTLHAICDRVAVIAEKRVLVVGPIAEVAAHDHPWIREYFGGPRGRAALRDAPGAAKRAEATEETRAHQDEGRHPGESRDPAPPDAPPGTGSRPSPG